MLTVSVISTFATVQESVSSVTLYVPNACGPYPDGVKVIDATLLISTRPPVSRSTRTTVSGVSKPAGVTKSPETETAV